MKIEKRVAVVTGGSKGIGASIVHRLLAEGVDVVTCARNETNLKELTDSVAHLKGKLETISTDIVEKGAAKLVLKKAEECFGGVDVLVNNVGGIANFGGFEELDDDDFYQAFDLNVMTTVRFCREAIPLLRKSKTPRIINISSIVGSQPGYANPHYSLTKAATINLGKHFSNILSKDKILVNTICPAQVQSELYDKALDSYAETNKCSRQEADSYFSQTIPLGEIGDGDDVAGMVAYLISDQAKWITGSCFHINGGKLKSAF